MLILLGMWQAASLYAGSRLFPSPARIAAVLGEEVSDGALPFHLGVTLARVAVSFVLAMVIGTVIGLLLGRSERLDRWFQPWLVILLNVPALVVIILTYVWLGLAETALLLAVAVNKIPHVAVTLREGARSLDRDLAEMSQVYRFSRAASLRHVVLPQLAPYLLAAARNGLALIWKIVLVVELLGRSNGVGFQLQSYFQLFDVPRVMAYAVAFVACVLIVELVAFTPVERHFARWRR